MIDNRIEKINNRIKEHYEYLIEKGYEVVFLALQGSQNYGLDVYDEDYISDIDTKAVVLPSFEDFVYNKEPKSITIVLENNEHIDVKDIRIMFETYKKQNINFVETLFTEFKIVNPKYKELLKSLFDNAEEIAHINYNQALRCMAGMSMEKLKALQHSYPATKDKIDKYGYDPKQLHHILRMNDFIKEYARGTTFKDCLVSKERNYLIQIKKGVLPEKKAVELANITDKETKLIKDKYLKEYDEINQKGIDILNKVKFDILKSKFIEDLQKE